MVVGKVFSTVLGPDGCSRRRVVLQNHWNCSVSRCGEHLRPTFFVRSLPPFHVEFFVCGVRGHLVLSFVSKDLCLELTFSSDMELRVIVVNETVFILEGTELGKSYSVSSVSRRRCPVGPVFPVCPFTFSVGRPKESLI